VILEKELWELKRHLNEAKKEVQELREMSVKKLPSKHLNSSSK
jgi:hypothetical protein